MLLPTAPRDRRWSGGAAGSPACVSVCCRRRRSSEVDVVVSRWRRAVQHGVAVGRMTTMNRRLWRAVAVVDVAGRPHATWTRRAVDDAVVRARDRARARVVAVVAGGGRQVAVADAAATVAPAADDAPVAGAECAAAAAAAPVQPPISGRTFYSPTPLHLNIVRSYFARLRNARETLK